MSTPQDAVIVIEGAGGVTVEIREEYSFADLARDLSLPVLIVAGNRLGVLNHLRLTIHCLQSEAVSLFGVILTDTIPEAFPAREPNETEVQRIVGRNCLGRVPYGATSLPEDVFSHYHISLIKSLWMRKSLKDGFSFCLNSSIALRLQYRDNVLPMAEEYVSGYISCQCESGNVYIIPPVGYKYFLKFV